MRLLSLILVFICVNWSFEVKYKVPKQEEEKESSYWYSQGREDLDFSLNRKVNNKVAKNIIIFLGDGMGITVTTAGRIFKGQKAGNSGEEESLIWEKFPNVALSKTYNVDKQVPDSAATATAFLGGVKANYYTIGVNARVEKDDCKASLEEENRVHSILKWAQEDGKDTGIVTSTRVTHATPAALYAHSAQRYWECDTELKKSKDVEGCKDIAQQLVEDSPGKDINVIFGGGRRQLGAPLPGDKGGCLRNDSRNLVEEWLEDKRSRGAEAKYVKNNLELKNLDPENLDYIMGLFGGSHMPYSYARDDSPEGTPDLKTLTEMAIKRLQRNSEGFFLLVEGGRIDHALHDTKPHPALQELIEFEEAVHKALEMTDEDETLVIVTADHSHTITINGYPDRGNDILGLTKYDHVTDKLPYTTLMFTNGNATNFTWNGEKVERSNLTGVDTRDVHFMSLAAVPVEIGYETHGGEDVAIYANGPMSHLFHRVHEQSYIAHVMAYAACVGPYTDDCSRPDDDDDDSIYHPVTAESHTATGVTPSAYSAKVLISLLILRFLLV